MTTTTRQIANHITRQIQAILPKDAIVEVCHPTDLATEVFGLHTEDYNVYITFTDKRYNSLIEKTKAAYNVITRMTVTKPGTIDSAPVGYANTYWGDGKELTALYVARFFV